MTLSEYTQLKQQIVYSVNACDRHSQLIKTLKENFAEEINSPRRLEQITTVGQLLKVLELRNVLSESNVDALKSLAHTLPEHGDLLKKIADYEMSRVMAKKLKFHAVPKENVYSYIENTSNKEPETINTYNNVHYGMSDKKQKLIYETLQHEVGTYWRDFARHLRLRESEIDNIDNQNRNLHSKMLAVLNAYERKADPQRWFHVICEALDNSQRRDLSRDLREIMMMNV